MTEEKTLKIKFKINDLELELEGQQQTVKNEFEKFKTFINNHFLDPNKEEKKEETLFTEKELTIFAVILFFIMIFFLRIHESSNYLVPIQYPSCRLDTLYRHHPLFGTSLL